MQAPVTVVEYGPGSGPLSRAVLSMPWFDAESTLLLIEKQEALAERLRTSLRKDTRVRVHTGSAEDVRALLSAPHADLVISSIPLSVMPDETAESIVRETAHVMAATGVFVVIVARPVIEHLLSKYFQDIQGSTEPRNVPPLWIYEARQPRR